MNVFSSPYEQYNNRNGQSFELIKVIDIPDENHDAEVLPMFLIRFEDGVEIEAYFEEINTEEDYIHMTFVDYALSGKINKGILKNGK